MKHGLPVPLPVYEIHLHEVRMKTSTVSDAAMVAHSHYDKSLK